MRYRKLGTLDQALFFDSSSLHSLYIPSAFDRHVYGFLKEMGQGIQHCASRVEDLVSFVQQCNEMREITEEVSAATLRLRFANLFPHSCYAIGFQFSRYSTLVLWSSHCRLFDEGCENIRAAEPRSHAGLH